MLKWLRHRIASFGKSEEASWELEPYLTNNVRALLEIASKEGDSLTCPRVVRHILTFPDRDLAVSFQDAVPARWLTAVTKRDDCEAWQCECDREWAPAFTDLVLDTYRLWTLSLSIHSTLWAYTGMFDETGEQLWYVAPPLLAYD